MDTPYSCDGGAAAKVSSEAELRPLPTKTREVDGCYTVRLDTTRRPSRFSRLGRCRVVPIPASCQALRMPTHTTSLSDILRSTSVRRVRCVEPHNKRAFRRSVVYPPNVDFLLAILWRQEWVLRRVSLCPDAPILGAATNDGVLRRGVSARTATAEYCRFESETPPCRGRWAALNATTTPQPDTVRHTAAFEPMWHCTCPVRAAVLHPRVPLLGGCVPVEVSGAPDLQSVSASSCVDSPTRWLEHVATGITRPVIGGHLRLVWATALA